MPYGDASTTGHPVYLLRTAREWFFIHFFHKRLPAYVVLSGWCPCTTLSVNAFSYIHGYYTTGFCLTTRFLNKFRFSGSYFRKNLFSKEYNHVRNVCFQCQQTAGNKACVTTGVCGKQPETSNLQDELVCELIQLAEQLRRAEFHVRILPSDHRRTFHNLDQCEF